MSHLLKVNKVRIWNCHLQLWPNFVFPVGEVSRQVSVTSMAEKWTGRGSFSESIPLGMYTLSKPIEVRQFAQLCTVSEGAMTGFISALGRFNGDWVLGRDIVPSSWFICIVILYRPISTPTVSIWVCGFAGGNSEHKLLDSEPCVNG